MKQGESYFWARIIMHMLHMYIISIIMLLTVMLRIRPVSFQKYG